MEAQGRGGEGWWPGHQRGCGARAQGLGREGERSEGERRGAGGGEHVEGSRQRWRRPAGARRRQPGRGGGGRGVEEAAGAWMYGGSGGGSNEGEKACARWRIGGEREAPARPHW